MKPRLPAYSVCALIITQGITSPTSATEVSVCTDMGPLTIELLDDQAARHAANFLEYVDQGHYSNTVFHRVIAGFMIQGGGFDRLLKEKPTRAPIRNESRNGVSNTLGTVAAARTADPHSATAQYYINVVDNASLDGSGQNWGYTVFGRVASGMETVDQIAALPTRGMGLFPTDVPQPLVAVTSMARLDTEVLSSLPQDSLLATIRERIANAIEQNSYAEAMEWIGHYRAACGTMDSDLLSIEARTASALLRAARAQAALDEYFALADEAHPEYQAALELYRTVAPDAEPSTKQVVADCDAPSEPDIPDGAIAALEELMAAQNDVRVFMTESEMYLDCLSDVIDERDLSDEEQSTAVLEHNRMVSLMEQLAEEFNTQVRVFRARD